MTAAEKASYVGVSGVYVLKFDAPLGSDKHRAEFYVGYADNIGGRLHYHETGRGASITKAAVERGIGFQIALVIPGATRAMERQIKRRHNTRKFVESYLKRQELSYEGAIA